MKVQEIFHLQDGAYRVQYLDDEGKQRFYFAVEGDEAPLNKLFIEGVKSKKYDVIEDTVIPTEQDNSTNTEEREIKNQEADAIAQIQQSVDGQLAVLVSPRYIAKGMVDPEFETKRIQSIKEWIEIDKQPGYPNDIEWPEVWQ